MNTQTPTNILNGDAATGDMAAATAPLGADENRQTPDLSIAQATGQTADPTTAGQTIEAQADSGDQALSEKASDEANKELVAYMMRVLEGGRAEAYNLYGRLKWSYWLLIVLSVVLFIVGLVLLSSPLWIQNVLDTTESSAFNWFATFFPAALGIADLLALYLYNPLARINRLMGDISQLAIILNSYHICIALRAVESDGHNRPSIGAAAEHVHVLTKSTVSLIKRHFGEDDPEAKLESTAN